MSNTFRASMVRNSAAITRVARSKGSVTCQNTCQLDAPSTRADSKGSPGRAASPARQMRVVMGVHIQVSTSSSAAMTDFGLETHALGGSPTKLSSQFRTPMVGLIIVIHTRAIATGVAIIGSSIRVRASPRPGKVRNAQAQRHREHDRPHREYERRDERGPESLVPGEELDVILEPDESRAEHARGIPFVEREIGRVDERKDHEEEHGRYRRPRQEPAQIAIDPALDGGPPRASRHRGGEPTRREEGRHRRPYCVFLMISATAFWAFSAASRAGCPSMTATMAAPMASRVSGTATTTGLA